MERTKKLFSLFILILVFNLPCIAQQKDSLLVELSRKWSNSKAYALKMAELMPEKYYDFKPVPEEMSFKEQLLHIADNIQWVTSSYLFTPSPKIIQSPKNLGKKELIRILSKSYEIGMQAHQNISPLRFNEKVSFFAGPKTRRQMLILLHDHQSHHLGQLIVYLRLKGIKPPDYVGW